MDINLLQEFTVLAQSKTFLNAADILFISQPTLSRHIKNLEAELGVPLFERTTRSSKLSKYGNMLFPYAKQIVELHNQFTSELMAEKQEQHSALRIGTIPAMAYYGITTVLTRFREKNPKIKMNIIPSYNVSVIDMLLRRDCEVAFAREQEFEQSDGSDDIVSLPLTSDHLIAVVPDSHPFAEYDSIHLSEFINQDIITLSRETIICEIVCAACEKAGFEPNLVLTDHNIDHIIDCVRLGMGTALLMDKHVEENRPSHTGIKVLEVRPVTSTRISLCYLKHTRLSDGALKFIRTYQEEFGQREP
ncbi:MAG: LysR family transcriptional regulator [Oscillospiraceae bacterium]